MTELHVVLVGNVFTGKGFHDQSEVSHHVLKCVCVCACTCMRVCVCNFLKSLCSRARQTPDHVCCL